MNFTLKLRKPFPIAGGEPLTSITFREPGAEDALTLDSPFISTLIPQGKDANGQDLDPKVEMKVDVNLLKGWLTMLLEKPAMGDVFAGNATISARELGTVKNWLGAELNPSDEPDTGQATKN